MISRADEVLDALWALWAEWDALPCVCGYKVPNANNDDTQCLSCASVDLSIALTEGSEATT